MEEAAEADEIKEEASAADHAGTTAAANHSLSRGAGTTAAGPQDAGIDGPKTNMVINMRKQIKKAEAGKPAPFRPSPILESVNKNGPNTKRSFITTIIVPNPHKNKIWPQTITIIDLDKHVVKFTLRSVKLIKDTVRIIAGIEVDKGVSNETAIEMVRNSLVNTANRKN